MYSQSRTILKTVFGYDDFRPLQAEIIAQVLQKQDALIVMPTGGGKSLCYQIPALLFEGLTVVISPLISLMKDQVEQLTEVGVSAVLLNSSLSRKEYSENFQRVKKGEAKLLYLAPESLFKPSILSLLKSLRVDCLTIDEAHCISEWGHDFRPEYRKIARVREKFPAAVCLALTATATPRVQEDICANLGMKQNRRFIASFNRKNLFLRVVPKSIPLQQILDFLRNFREQSGIIYCFSRKQVEALAESLQAHGLSARPYHAGMSDEERKQNQELFIRDEVLIIVATIAFGMGINKSNVRFVIHHDLPKSIESYYQEIGRAGRDGLRSECLLLFSHADTSKIRYFIEQKESLRQREVAFYHLDRLVDFAETETCRRIPLINYFGEAYNIPTCGMCDNCTSEKPDQTDVTVAAQKFLSCVYRTGQLFGSAHIIDVLLGSQSQKVFRHGHQHLSTYGIGTNLTKKQWGHLARQLLRRGYLARDASYGSLKLNARSRRVLSGEEKVYGTLQEAELRAASPGIDAEYDRNLFELLRQERKILAGKSNLPPYVIFSDRTLTEMATYFPQSPTSLAQMHGVGSAKLEKYGARFLSIIRRYCHENEIQEQPKFTRERRHLQKPTAKSKPRYVVVGEAYNNGSTIEYLMESFSVKLSTILNHLYKYFQEGHLLRSDGFLSLSSYNENQQAAVFFLFDKLGTRRLRPVADALDADVDFDELRLLRLYYLNR